jgi:peptide deformylase
MMKIITVPHRTLRTTAQPVEKVDKKVRQFIQDLEKTLAQKNNPRGVGLAAPQVDNKWRIFSTQLPMTPESEEYRLRTFINPRITDHSQAHTFGADPKEPTLEGCLSIPGFYGPIPRWEWVDLAYDYIDGDELKTSSEHFDDFAARVIQHEHDHLDGVLFIDYTIEYDLPLYKEDPKTEKLIELEPEIVLALSEKTK